MLQGVEHTVRIEFTQPSLGNVKDRGKSGRFLMPKSRDGRVLFLQSWHLANMRSAAHLLGRHQDAVADIFWDVCVEGAPRRWHRRYYVTPSGKSRFVLHEAFLVGQRVDINCVVPSRIGGDDFWRLMQLAGRYRGLSPWKPGEFGLYEVITLRPRRVPAERSEEGTAAEAEGQV